MTHPMSRERRMAEFQTAADKMYAALEEWYDQYPEASLGEIEQEARRLRRELMGKTLEVLINGRSTGASAHPPKCPQCQQPMAFEDYRPWGVSGLEGEIKLERAYYVCPRCDEQTIFPPRPEAPAADRPLE
jgi:hypothetical protein